MSDAQEILREVEALVAARLRQGRPAELAGFGGQRRAAQPDWLQQVCALLQRARSHYNWVGVYFLEGTELVLGPYVGAPSPHTCIPLDQGICGAAVREGRTVVVPDVNADPRYLACSLDTKSEIVVPIEADGRILGEMDIDSHRPDAFGADDQALLEQVAQRLASVLVQERMGRA